MKDENVFGSEHQSLSLLLFLFLILIRQHQIAKKIHPNFLMMIYATTDSSDDEDDERIDRLIGDFLAKKLWGLLSIPKILPLVKLCLVR